jgi:hypothetical protein
MKIGKEIRGNEERPLFFCSCGFVKISLNVSVEEKQVQKERRSSEVAHENKDLDNVIYKVNSFGDGFIWYGDSFGLAPYIYPFGDEKNGASVRPYYSGGGTPPLTMTDYDGNFYDVVQVGSYYYTKQNWKCTRLNNGTSIPLVTDGTTWAGLTTLARCAYDNNSSYV